MISIWLCPDYNNELYLQNVINSLSDIHNSPRFSPHCTLVGGIKSNKYELEKIIDNSIDNIGPIIVQSKRISYTNILWKTVFIELVVNKNLKSLQNSIYTEIKSNIDYKFDPSLIGGLVIQVGSIMIDTSIKTKLKKLEKNMIEA